MLMEAAQLGLFQTSLPDDTGLLRRTNMYSIKQIRTSINVEFCQFQKIYISNFFAK